MLQNSMLPMCTLISVSFPACAFNHFQSNDKCPLCKHQLQENQIFELVVAESSNSGDESLKNSLQLLFTKPSRQPSTADLGYGDMVRGVLSHIDNVKFQAKFVLYQIGKDLRQQVAKNANAGREIARLRKEMEVLKQKTSSEKLEYDREIAGFMQRLDAQDTQIADLKVSLQEKQVIINQFRAKVSQGAISSSGSADGARRLSNMKIPPPTHGLQHTMPQSNRGLLRRPGEDQHNSMLQSARKQQQQRHPMHGRMGDDLNSPQGRSYSSETIQSDSSYTMGEGQHARSQLGFQQQTHGGRGGGISSSQPQFHNKRRRVSNDPLVHGRPSSSNSYDNGGYAPRHSSHSDGY